MEVPDRGGGTIRLPNAPWHFSDAEVGVRGEPRYRGEDNRAVLAEVLGYDDATHRPPRGRGRAVEPRPGVSPDPMSLRFPVSPMKATLGTLPTEDDGWAFEIKWDGYRTLAFVDDGAVRLQSSNLYDVTAKYPEIAPLAGAVGHSGRSSTGSWSCSTTRGGRASS